MAHYPNKYQAELQALRKEIDDAKQYVHHLEDKFERLHARGLVGHDVILSHHLIHVSNERWAQIKNTEPAYVPFEAWDKGKESCGSSWIHRYSFGDLVTVVDNAENFNEEGIVIGETEVNVYLLQTGNDEKHDGLKIERLDKRTTNIVLKKNQLFWRK